MTDSGLVIPAEVGGLYGINVETLTGDKTLTPGTDKIYQYFDEGGDDRTITLDTASAVAGDRFVIRHNGNYQDTHYLSVKQAALELDRIFAGAIKGFVFDGTNWMAAIPGAGDFGTLKNNIALGWGAQGQNYGTAVGNNAKGGIHGAALGDGTMGFNYGVAVGAASSGYDFGTAIGCYAKTGGKKFSIALGYMAECTRAGETTINIEGGVADKYNVVQGRWSGSTANDTPKEIFCAGQANARFTIRAKSALAFRMTIVARDNVAGHVAMYTVVDGLIKRDGANNTVMVNCTVTIVFEDDAAWDVAVTADDGNEALIITVTGDDTNPTQWAAVMDGVETHF